MPEDKGLSKSPRAEREEKVLEFWKQNKIFEKTLSKDAPKGEFVFYEGPPGANGRPGVHHMESRFFKDAIPRYKTMQGFRVPRRAGWDTHGLPVELEAEKTLGIKNKKEIEEMGIDKFNAECRKIVWKYVDEWEKLTERIGFWLDFKDAYVTYHNSFIEGVWKVMRHVEERNLLYKDYKVVPWCPRCGTGLSSHELALGYRDVKDLSLYVKFKVKGEEHTYLLAWTTTPWTLPGNIALAVGADIEYVKARVVPNAQIGIGDGTYEVSETEYVYLAKAILEKLNQAYPNGPYILSSQNFGLVPEKTIKGSELVGLSYEPLYPFVESLASESEKPKLEKAFKVYAADFVTTEDGTGIVHTAVMYGQEDFDLGTKIGLPKVHLVNPDATFAKGTGWLEGRSVIDETLAVDILKDLQEKGNFFHKENYTHTYPFCWRCKTRLIYYARDSWYIRMSALRDELMKENEKINWEPDYIKQGRFGEWLKEVKDWAISRERYWGTPLPIWQNADGSKRIVVDSVDTLRAYAKKSGNTYLVMRHGGTEGNAHERVSYKEEANDHLTAEGKQQVFKSAEALKDKHIDLIVASPFVRTTETAEIVRETLGLPEDALVYDERFKEVDPGEFDGRNWTEYHNYMYETGPGWFERKIPGGEALSDVARRIGAALSELERTHKGKNILIVTHGGPAWLSYVVSGLYQPENRQYKPADTHVFIKEFERFANAEVRELPFVILPHDENYRIDLHRPYIDEVVLEKDGEEYTRVKEVMDVWFDSGAMPFATNVPYPADFIAEGVDQTRGWFYTLHAVGALMERGHAFNNVICLGLILDKEGKKMSKSLGNAVDPWQEIEKFGVDVLRLWMYSVNQPGDSKNFDERSVDEIQKRVFNLLDNVYTFYELYRDRSLEGEGAPESTNVLDLWIMARLQELVINTTSKLNAFKLLEPVREMRGFIDDLSTWYVRRSRDRLKEGDVEAKQTLYFVLKTLSKLLAPFAPFAAEELFQKLRVESDPESVHLADWPLGADAARTDANELITRMKRTREIVSQALEVRSKANIKIRQPLASLSVALNGAYADLIADEVNVKEVKDVESEGVVLDTVLTPELEEEGRVREIIRSIQDMRKEKNLNPSDVMPYSVPEEYKELFQKYAAEITKTTNITLE